MADRTSYVNIKGYFTNEAILAATTFSHERHTNC